MTPAPRQLKKDLTTINQARRAPSAPLSGCNPALTARYCNEADRACWDAYVLNHPGSTHCHLSVWKDIIEGTYGHKSYYLLAESNAKITGILPLVHMKSLLFGNRLVSMPFMSYGGVLADSPAIADLLLQQAIKTCSDLKASRIELRHLHPTDGLFPDNPGNYDILPGANKVRMILDLPALPEELFSSFKSKLRSQILRPKKEGMTFAIGGEELLNDFYRVFATNMRDLGSPVHSKRLFHKLFHHLGDHSKLGIVKHRDLPVAAGLIVTFRDTAEILWASSLRDFNRLGPNMLLYWSFLEYTCIQGFRHFDFGRSTPAGGTYKFKEQWGAQPRKLHWDVYGRFGDGKEPSENNSAWMVRATQVWQRLPVFVTNLIGPRIRASISL